MSISVRFAPSPTGLLHIGNIRAALYNFLFARKLGGSFMLRMDDTDQVRSTPEFEAAIKRDLTWLGITWDTFAKQSDRTHRYTEELEKLKAAGRVYPCFETKAELDLKRKTQLGRGLPPVYDRASLKLSPEDIAKKIAEGHKPHWRFKLEHRDTAWDDLIQGHKVFPAGSVSDPVIVREDGVPLYTFCSIVDDVDFSVTHVIRGEDHVTNTSVQIQIWEAVSGKPAPTFAHFPLLVSASGEEMSKRLGSFSVGQMRDEMHIEPMAVNSLLAKIGTSDPIAPFAKMEDLIPTFDLAKISRATAKFDMEEIKHLSAKILHVAPFTEVSQRLDSLGLGHVTEEFWTAVCHNLETIEDVRLWWQVTHGPVTPIIADAGFSQAAAEALPSGDWDQNTWSVWTNAVKEKTGRKGKELFMPLRQAVTGTDHGPELKVLLPLIGRDRVLARLSGKAA